MNALSQVTGLRNHVNVILTLLYDENSVLIKNDQSHNRKYIRKELIDTLTQYNKIHDVS
jgi:hypothetical protein